LNKMDDEIFHCLIFYRTRHKKAQVHSHEEKYNVGDER
jgi:hypothetical protein